ncbi:protein NO VEIN domain-containing protein [Rhizobium ruizarguesonis]
MEKENLGYDLVATRNEEVLHIEVKGRSGSDVCAELTVNEFDCLRNYQRQRSPNAHYRIAIVTDALNKPIIDEFVMVRGQKSQWCTLDGRWRLNFEERMAAKLTCVSNLEPQE